MAKTVTLTQELLAEECADAMGYCDTGPDAAAVRARYERQAQALGLLPVGYMVERRDYLAGFDGFKRGHVFTAVDSDGGAVRCAEATRWRRNVGENAINLGSTYGEADECEAQCKAVVLLLAAVDYEAHARKAEVTD